MGHRIDRLWLLGGVVLTVLVAAVGWFVLIQPAYANAAAVRNEVGDESLQLTKLNHDIADLNAKKKQMPQLKAKLKAYQAALPVDSTGITSFLRQLQASGTAVGTDVSGITVGAPNESEAIPHVFELPVTLAASGNADTLSKFLNQLQTVQARAVLVSAVSLASGGDTSDPNAMQASISLTIFVTSSNGTSASLTTN